MSPFYTFLILSRLSIVLTLRFLSTAPFLFICLPPFSTQTLHSRRFGANEDGYR